MNTPDFAPVPSLDYTSASKRIVEHLKSAFVGLSAAGELYAQLIDQDPKFRERIQSDFPDFPPSVWSALERIGRKLLLPAVFLGEGPGFLRLCEMPYDLQERYAKEPIDVLVLDGSGKSDTLKVAVANLTQEQVRQVFDKHYVRSIAAQKAYIIGKRQSAIPTPIESEYVIKKDTVTFTKPCILTRQQLLQIAASMS